MSKPLLISSLLFFSVLLSSCASEVNTPLKQSEKIVVGKGPEDLLIDNSNGQARLIISCGDFRNMGKSSRKGSIYSYDFQSGVVLPFVIASMPDSIKLFPHGISLQPGSSKLYVVNHNLDNDPNKHSVLIFKVEERELIFEQVIADRNHLTSPNDLTVLPDGSFYITNTGPFTMGSFFMRMFKSYSNVTYYDADKKTFKVAFDKIGVANGVQIVGEKIYAANSFNNKLYELNKAADGSLTLSKKIEVTRQMDNLFFDQTTNKLYVASHDSFIKLNKSKTDSTNLSPFKIHIIDLKTNTVSEVLRNDGSLISGVSTAVMYDGYLYLSQIFDNYIVKVKL